MTRRTQLDELGVRVLRRTKPDGLVLPHGPRDERHFPTADRKARSTVNTLTVVRVPPGRLHLRTVRCRGIH
ncbi:hypothetical protein [Streptomyces sp. NPDC048282]|uniref:hypothetical protein n=1 Tax=unclassified Streptomyces TaxID=2593676 RepID=UPI003713CC6F